MEEAFSGPTACSRTPSQDLRDHQRAGLINVDFQDVRTGDGPAGDGDDGLRSPLSAWIALASPPNGGGLPLLEVSICPARRGVVVNITANKSSSSCAETKEVNEHHPRFAADDATSFSARSTTMPIGEELRVTVDRDGLGQPQIAAGQAETGAKNRPDTCLSPGWITACSMRCPL